MGILSDLIELGVTDPVTRKLAFRSTYPSRWCRAGVAWLLMLLLAVPSAADAQSRQERQGIKSPPVERLPRFEENRPPVLAPSKSRRPALRPLARSKVPTGAKIAVAPSAAPPPAAPASPPVQAAATNAGASEGAPMTMATFLDRLMMAESGGRLDARNSRSTALGPYQFIESTFLAVARRHLSSETEKLTLPQILALRTDPVISRRAAEAYTLDNAAMLKASDIEPTYPHLRLAFLLGAGGAIKVLKAPPDTPLRAVLSPAVLIANPFMATMTARGLALRSAREVNQPITTRQVVDVPPGTTVARRAAAAPAIVIRCNQLLPSCRRWVALQQAKLRAAASPKGRAVRKSFASTANLAGVSTPRTVASKTSPRR